MRQMDGDVVDGQDETESLNLVRAGEGLENRAVFEQRVRAISEATGRVLATLDRMERLLTLVDRVLRVSQPPVPGNIGIRWWHRNGRDELRFPVLVTWVRLRNGRWRSRRLPQVRKDRINREGSAAINAEQTYHLALLASRLIKVYEGLAAQLGMSLTVLNRSHAKADHPLAEAEALITVAHRQVTKKLLNAGYEVDRDTMDMIDRAGL